MVCKRAATKGTHNQSSQGIESKMRNKLQLSMNDLDHTGKPIMELCKKCNTKIPKSKITAHHKRCNISHKSMINKGRYHPPKVDDKPPLLSVNMHYPKKVGFQY